MVAARRTIKMVSGRSCCRRRRHPYPHRSLAPTFQSVSSCVVGNTQSQSSPSQSYPRLQPRSSRIPPLRPRRRSDFPVLDRRRTTRHNHRYPLSGLSLTHVALVVFLALSSAIESALECNDRARHQSRSPQSKNKLHQIDRYMRLDTTPIFFPRTATGSSDLLPFNLQPFRTMTSPPAPSLHIPPALLGLFFRDDGFHRAHCRFRFRRRRC